MCGASTVSASGISAPRDTGPEAGCVSWRRAEGWKDAGRTSGMRRDVLSAAVRVLRGSMSGMVVVKGRVGVMAGRIGPQVPVTGRHYGPCRRTRARGTACTGIDQKDISSSGAWKKMSTSNPSMLTGYRRLASQYIFFPSRASGERDAVQLPTVGTRFNVPTRVNHVDYGVLVDAFTGSDAEHPQVGYY
jgi:hypothetical protein